MDIARWHTLSLAEQLGNIGSEVGRIRVWKGKGDAHAAEQAFSRALDCIDATLADPRWRGRYKEVALLREVLADCVHGGGAYDIPLTDLERYCTDFAMIARS